MATKKVTQGKRAQKKRAEKPVTRIEEAAKRIGATPSESAKAEPAPPTVDAALDAEEAAEKARTKSSYEKAGIPFADYPKSEEQRAHERLMLLEKRVLASNESDSLRSRIMRILSAGSYVDADDCTPERALLRYAAATSKAAGLALMGAEYVRSNSDFEIDFSDEDAAIVMCGLSELLEVAPALLTSISIADNHASKAEIGGAA